MATSNHWMARFLLYRGVFLTYLIGFLVAYRQFTPLAGEDGILPFTLVTDRTSAWRRPSLLHWFPSDGAVRTISIAGMVLSSVGLLGIEWAGTLPVALMLLAVWALYLSLVNVGYLFYGYGWESFLCEAGVLAAFLGGAKSRVPTVMLFLLAWLLFRVMMGAGLIKLRGDECWWNLTCMDFHYETQPMPNPLSWYAHHMPDWWHKLEVIVNHFVELLVPVLYFTPQPYAGVAGAVTLGFQAWLMLTGNFSWLNFLTGVLAVSLIPDAFFGPLVDPLKPAVLTGLSAWHHYAVLGYAAVVAFLSYWPARNLLSSNQMMNAGFDPFNLVNTYGAFGSITRTRFELVVQGRRSNGEWKTYDFPGKPTDPAGRPPQWAPYHLRLDWQLWFAAMKHRPSGWLVGLVRKLLENDEITNLLAHNPFEDGDPPEEIRVLRYRYGFTDPEERRRTGRWWNRERVGKVLPTMDRETARQYHRQMLRG